VIVGVVYVAVAAVLAIAGRGRIQGAAPPTPEQTIETVKEDVQWAKTRARSGRT
jgi:Putative Actinobacterial Holin-X, holin superfamily III